MIPQTCDTVDHLSFQEGKIKQHLLMLLQSTFATVSPVKGTKAARAPTKGPGTKSD
jgi:hypothetical protein